MENHEDTIVIPELMVCAKIGNHYWDESYEVPIGNTREVHGGVSEQEPLTEGLNHMKRFRRCVVETVRQMLLAKAAEMGHEGPFVHIELQRNEHGYLDLPNVNEIMIVRESGADPSRWEMRWNLNSPELLHQTFHESMEDCLSQLDVNADQLIEPHADRQRVIDEVRRSRGCSVVCHPLMGSDFDHCPPERLDSWEGFAGIEIYNGEIERLEGDPRAAARWDMLLSRGRRVWGLANDDSHHDGESGAAWNMVFAEQRSIDAVLKAMERGRFYASTGVTITSLRVEGTRIVVETENAERITALSEGGRRIAVSHADAIAVDASAGSRYIRFECRGQGGRSAWTQPFFLV